MFKLIKKLFKVVGIIVGAYLAFNTFCLAKIGASRVLRQMRLQHDDLVDSGCSLGEYIYAVDSAALEEEADEWAAWNDWKNNK